MAATQLITLSFGISVPNTLGAGTLIPAGSAIKITGKVTDGSGDLTLYEWYPELSEWRLFTDTTIAVDSTKAQFCARYAWDRDATGYLFLLVPENVTIESVKVRGVYY